MYTIDDHDRVVEISELPPQTGYADPIVLADEHAVILAYCAQASRPDEAASTSTVAFVCFKAYAHQFGPPNDEALEGHPLAARGLAPYSSFRIENSSWIRSLERQNSVHCRHSKEHFMKGKQHFIITFHGRTFECIASDFKVEVLEIDERDTLTNLAAFIRATSPVRP